MQAYHILFFATRIGLHVTFPANDFLQATRILAVESDKRSEDSNGGKPGTLWSLEFREKGRRLQSYTSGTIKDWFDL
jgi:hypothetical protein